MKHDRMSHDRMTAIVVLLALFAFGMIQAVIHGISVSENSEVNDVSDYSGIGNENFHDFREVCTSAGTIMNDTENYSVTLNSDVSCRK